MNAAKRREAMETEVTIDQMAEIAVGDDGLGLCLHCGQQAADIQADARKYRCETCGTKAVYGADELALMLI